MVRKSIGRSEERFAQVRGEVFERDFVEVVPHLSRDIVRHLYRATLSSPNLVSTPLARIQRCCSLLEFQSPRLPFRPVFDEARVIDLENDVGRFEVT